MTAIRIGFGAASSFFASTTALTIEIAVTDRRHRRPDDLEAGVPVDRRPSESSSGWTRKFRTE